MSNIPSKARESGLAEVLTPGLRRYLYLTSAICGAAVLVVEILGAKMLAPYFGTSHFVWTAQIAVTLVSLSVGYYLGGWLVDRAPRLTGLFVCILASASYLCLTVPLCQPVAQSCLGLKLALGSLVAATFLFLVPLALLATVGPFLVRTMTSSLTVVGGQVGRLNAISTIGSVAGTVLIGYALIPFLPNSITMLATAATLMVVSVVYFILWGHSRRQRAAAVIVALVGLSAGGAEMALDTPVSAPSLTELTRRNSEFGLIQVFRTSVGRRVYLNDYLPQNTYDPDRRQSASAFTYMLHLLSRAYTPRIDDALCIGMGVGIVPMALAREGVNVDVVEINPGIVPVAREFFDFDESRVRLTIDDGRHFLNRPPRRYDTIVLDAFLGDSSPSHLMTREAFAAMRDALKPGGTLVINALGNLHEEGDYYVASLDKTLRAVFQSVKIHASERSSPVVQNVYFVAADRPDLEFAHAVRTDDVHFDVRSEVQMAMRRVVQMDPGHGRVLTDDFNPVEFYDADNREQLRRSLVAQLGLRAATRLR